MSRLACLIPLVALLIASVGCGEQACTLVGCSSSLVVSYGDIVVNEAYSLTINPGGQTITVTCLDPDPDAEPPPDWLTCDANGFEVTGDDAQGTTISVTVVPLSTQTAVIPSALVPLIVEETLQPNGPDCDPVCYRRVGTVTDA